MHTAGFMLKVCCFCLLCWLRESKTRGKTIESDREREKEKEGGKTRESWATEQHCAKQLWHSQIFPWLLSAGTWTLGLLGFGGQPRPHNPPSAPSSCLTPLWPRAEDRKIRAVPSQRDSFILPAGIPPVTMAYIMGNIAGPRRNQSPPPPPNNLLFFFLTNLSFSLPPFPPCCTFSALPPPVIYLSGPRARAHLLHTPSTQSWSPATHKHTHVHERDPSRTAVFTHAHAGANAHALQQMLCSSNVYFLYGHARLAF